MRALTILLAIAFLFVSAETASAAPVAAAITALVGVVKAGGLAAAFVKLAFGLAAQYGVSLIQKARAKKQQARSEPRGVTVQVRVGDDQPAQFIIGTYATAGIRKYIGSWGQVDKTPNAFITDVIELSCIPHPGISGMWVDDTKGTILWNEPHPDGRGCPIQEFRVSGTDYAWVRFVNGKHTVADPWLVSKFGNSQRPFKATMIGRGIAFAVVTFRLNPDKFSNLPACLFEMLPMPLYDLRKDSTNGGNGPQRWNDQSTWEPSDNNAVADYNIIRGIHYGDEWIFGGQNLSAFRLPASSWIAAANECDRSIIRADGTTEKQFRCGYEVRLDMEPLSVIDDIRQGASARIAEVGGSFKILVGAPGAAVYSFSDADILVTEEQSFEPFRSLSDTHNGIEATYPEPAEKWASKDAPARYSSSLEAEDGNRRLVTGVDFPAVPFGRQVQALMKAMIEEERRFRIHIFHLPPEAFALEPNDVTAWSSDRNGYANKKFLVVDIAGGLTFNQLVLLKEMDPSDYGWSSADEKPTDIGWLGPIVAPPQPMTGWTAVEDKVEDADGKAMRPAIRVGCGADMDDVDRVHVMVRFKESQAIVFDSDQTPYPRPGSGHPCQWLLSGAWCLPAKWYQVAGKFVPKSNRVTEWSAWIDVLTPNVQATDVSVGLGQVQNDVNQRFKDLQAEFEAAFKRQSQSIIDFSLVNAIGHRQQMEMRAELGTALASISEERRVRVTEAEALAQQILTLRAQLGTANATITELRQTQATDNSALSSRLTTLDAKVGKNLGRLEQEEIVRASQDAVMVARAGMLEAQVASNRARIIAEETTRADAVSAVAQSISGVSADLNDRFGGGLIKFAAAVDQSGVNVRYSIVMRANLGDQYKETGQYYEIYTENGVLKSRAATKVDQWVVTDGVTRNYAMVYQGGVLRLNIADIGTIYAGKMIFGSNKLIIDGYYGTIEVWH